MSKKLSTLALCVVVAVLAFIAGTMLSTATATQAPTAERKYIGAVIYHSEYAEGGKIIYAVYDLGGTIYYTNARQY